MEDGQLGRIGGVHGYWGSDVVLVGFVGEAMCRATLQRESVCGLEELLTL